MSRTRASASFGPSATILTSRWYGSSGPGRWYSNTCGVPLSSAYRTRSVSAPPTSSPSSSTSEQPTYVSCRIARPSSGARRSSTMPSRVRRYSESGIASSSARLRTSLARSVSAASRSAVASRSVSTAPSIVPSSARIGAAETWSQRRPDGQWTPSSAVTSSPRNARVDGSSEAGIGRPASSAARNGRTPISRPMRSSADIPTAARY